MLSARDVLLDLHIVRLVSTNESAGFVAIHQARVNGGVGRVAADEAVAAELKHVAKACDRDRVLARFERTLFDRRHIFSENYLVNLVQTKARDFDRGVGEDKFLELDLQLSQIPLAFLTEPIDRKPQQTLFDSGEMIDPDGGDRGKADVASRFEPNFPVQDQIVLADEDRHAEAQRADGARDVANVRGIALPHTARWRPQIADRNAHEFEERRYVITGRTRRPRRRRQARKSVAPLPTLALELIFQGTVGEKGVAVVVSHLRISS